MKKAKTPVTKKAVQPTKRKRALYMDGRGKKRMVDLDAQRNPIVNR